MRILTLALLSAAISGASPITIMFSGNVTGTVGEAGSTFGLRSFTDQPFTLTFRSDTTALLSPGSISGFPDDRSTPNDGTLVTNTFDIAGIAGSLSPECYGGGGLQLCLSAQDVFVDTVTHEVGIWNFPVSFGGSALGGNSWLVAVDPAFSAWDMTTSIGPLSVQTILDTTADPFSVVPGQKHADLPGLLRAGITFTSVSDVTFQAIVDTSAPAPEPSTPVLVALGLVGLMLGRMSRRRR